MTDISDFETRIAGALDRIRYQIERRQKAEAETAGRDGPSVAELEQKLAEERTVTAQLEERVKALKERQDSKIVKLEKDLDAARTANAGLEMDLAGLRQANAELENMVSKLRDAIEEGVAEPELVNRAMKAELDGLRAMQAADAAEIGAVLAELKTVVEEDV
jgi:chromosome segregation ATPase